MNSNGRPHDSLPGPTSLWLPERTGPSSAPVSRVSLRDTPRQDRSPGENGAAHERFSRLVWLTAERLVGAPTRAVTEEAHRSAASSLSALADGAQEAARLEVELRDAAIVDGAVGRDRSGTFHATALQSVAPAIGRILGLK